MGGRGPRVSVGAPPLQYPALLRQAGIQGRVMARAIIDTTGRAEPASVEVIDSPHPGVNEAARNALLQARGRGTRSDEHTPEAQLQSYVVRRHSLVKNRSHND